MLQIGYSQSLHRVLFSSRLWNKSHGFQGPGNGLSYPRCYKYVERSLVAERSLTCLAVISLTPSRIWGIGHVIERFEGLVFHFKYGHSVSIILLEELRSVREASQVFVLTVCCKVDLSVYNKDKDRILMSNTLSIVSFHI